MNYRETDPEFAERYEHFTFDEVFNEPGPVSYTHLTLPTICSV